MRGRFVIQHHLPPGQAGHYDLMLETGPALATWRIDRLPGDLAPGESMPAQRLPDHRRAYLDYEGPVGGGRGQVRIAEAGAYEGPEGSDECWQLTLVGRAFTVAVCLRRLDATCWRLERPRRPEQTPA